MSFAARVGTMGTNNGWTALSADGQGAQKMMANRRILVAIGAACLSVLLATAAARAATLVGDCNGNNQVTIGEVTRCGRIHANALPLSNCTACDADCDGTVTELDVENAGHCFSNPAASNCPMVVWLRTPSPTHTTAANPTATTSPPAIPTATNTTVAQNTPTNTVTENTPTATAPGITATPTITATVAAASPTPSA